MTILAGSAVALFCGAAWGLFNGWCITKLRVSALISTLGSMGAALGAAYLVTDGNDIRTVPTALIAFGHGTDHERALAGGGHRRSSRSSAGSCCT